MPSDAGEKVINLGISAVTIFQRQLSATFPTISSIV
jgi:hypothetical protein